MLKPIEFEWSWRLLAAILASLLLLAGLGSQTIAHGDETDCEVEVSFISPADGEVLSGVSNIQIEVPQNANIQSLEILSGDNFVGRASEASPGIWELTWDTTTSPEATAGLTAEVNSVNDTTGESQNCHTAPVEVSISNDSQPPSEVSVEFNQPAWAGPTNFVVSLEAKVLVTNSGNESDVTDDAKLQWITSVGSLTSFHSAIDYFSGPFVGNGEIRVTAFYGARQVHKVFAINTVAAAAAGNYPFGGNDRVLDECLAANLVNRYDSLVEDGSRLTIDDLELAGSCFADRFSLLPINLAPLDPNRVSSLAENEALAIKGVSQAEVNSLVPSSLVLKGMAPAGSKVLIYINSETLVGFTGASDTGNWSFELVSPLEAGDHTATAISQTSDSEFGRSEQFNFRLDSVEPTAENPDALSLSLNQDEITWLQYIGWIILGVIGFAVILLAAIHNKTEIFHPHPNSSKKTD